MEFAKRMDLFGEGIFSKLSEVRRRKVSAGETVIDMSIGAPNIPPAAHIREALCRACLLYTSTARHTMGVSNARSQ